MEDLLVFLYTGIMCLAIAAAMLFALPVFLLVSIPLWLRDAFLRLKRWRRRSDV